MSSANAEISSHSLSSLSFTDDEIKKIDDYVAGVSIDDAVGQLFMVGIPSHFRDYDKESLETVFEKMGVGGAFYHTYHFYDSDITKEPEQNLQYAIGNFHDLAQQFSAKSTLRLPLIFGADFETPRFTSFYWVLDPPPSPLALSATYDPDLIHRVGKWVGLRMNRIGVSLIMGPVLDINKSKPGTTTFASQVVQNRSFGASSERVIAAASHYLLGLREGGILAVGKHFPGHGSVLTNPHDDKATNLPTYMGGLQHFKEDLSVYRSLLASLSGIMTAHISMSTLDQRKDSFVTFSESYVDRLLRGSGINIDGNAIESIGLKDQVIITDDLAEMAVIRKYMGGLRTPNYQYLSDVNSGISPDSTATDQQQLDFGKVAVAAFEAGHDILLFSHIKFKGQTTDGISVDELGQVIAYFKKHISSYDTRFRQSLRKVLLLKALTAKMINNFRNSPSTNPVSDMFNRHFMPVPIKDTVPEIDKILGASNLGQKLFQEVYRKAVVQINKFSDTRIYGFADPRRAIFYVFEPYSEKYRNSFSSGRSHKVVPLLHKRADNEKKWNRLYKDYLPKKLIYDLERFDRIYYTVVHTSDADVIEGLRVFCVNAQDNMIDQFHNKLVVLLFNSPHILSDAVLKSATVVNFFDRHPSAFDVAQGVILGTTVPSALSSNRMPINLGEEGSIYKENDTLELPVAQDATTGGDIGSPGKIDPNKDPESNGNYIIQKETDKGKEIEKKDEAKVENKGQQEKKNETEMKINDYVGLFLIVFSLVIFALIFVRNSPVQKDSTAFIVVVIFCFFIFVSGLKLYGVELDLSMLEKYVELKQK
ncbi:MAG: hypothetical protein H7829_00445 [Magnetococcus sp. THC-1_WYH]